MVGGKTQKMNLVKDYKQYFTPDKLAAYMVSIIPDDTIEAVVDLSMGECGLLEEAKKRWSNAELYGADIDKELIKLNKNVYVKNINEKKEETVLTADRGTVTKQMADVYDRVKIVTKDSVTTANEGHYDMVNRKIRAKGNVHVDYTGDKSASTILNDMTSTKKK